MWKIESDISPAILPSHSILFPEVLCIFPWMSYTYTHPYSFICVSFFLFNTSIHHCSEISFFQLTYLSTCQHKAIYLSLQATWHSSNKNLPSFISSALLAVQIVSSFFLLQMYDAEMPLLAQCISLYTGVILSTRKISCSLSYDRHCQIVLPRDQIISIPSTVCVNAYFPILFSNTEF